MSEDNLDAFINLIDDDPDWNSSDDEHPLFSTIEKEFNNKKKEALQNQFSDSDLQSQYFLNKESTKATESDNNNSKSIFLTTHNKQQLQKKIPKSYTRPKEGFIFEPFCRIKLSSNPDTLQIYLDEGQSIESALRDRNIGYEYKTLAALKSGQVLKKSTLWTCGILIKKLQGTRTSANGNEFLIWELVDTNFDNPTTLYLFGSAATSLNIKNLFPGSVVDLINPKVLENNNEKYKNQEKKLSISNSMFIKHIGMSIEFGICKSKTRTGANCQNPVNINECGGVCIHHASKELYNLDKKRKEKNSTKPKGNGNFKNFAKNVNSNNNKAKPGYSCTSNQEGIITTSFASYPVALDNGKLPGPSVRMELQSSFGQQINRNPLSKPQSSTITFNTDGTTAGYFKRDPDKVKLAVNLDPKFNPHLSEQDRKTLEAFEASNKNSDLPELLAYNNNNSAGSRNFLKYLNNKDQNSAQKKSSLVFEDTKEFGASKAVVLNRKTFLDMQKALSFVKKNGPIKKIDPNNSLKRPSSESSLIPSTSKNLGKSEKNLPSTSSSSSSAGIKRAKLDKTATGSSSKIVIEFDFESDEFNDILNAKSSHEKSLESIQSEEYFEKLVKKEAIENKLLSTFKVPTNAIMCNLCKYVALSQSDFCKEKNHPVKVVKAVKRFFKCKECGCRAMSLDRLPKKPCSNCKGTSWEQAPLGKEKKGPLLPTEKLSIRGDEEKFLGSTSSKLFL